MTLEQQQELNALQGDRFSLMGFFGFLERNNLLHDEIVLPSNIFHKLYERTQYRFIDDENHTIRFRQWGWEKPVTFVMEKTKPEVSVKGGRISLC